jgi:hypothetical protein
MPVNSTFTDELARLNQQNFFGGIAEGAQAVKEQRQNESLVSLFNQLKADPKNQQLVSTDQQLADVQSEINKNVGDNVNDSTMNIADAVQKYSTNMVKILQQKTAWTNLYQPYITTMATLGDDGVKTALSLSKELDQRTKTLDEYANIPTQAIQMKKNMLTIASDTLAIDKTSNEYKEWKDEIIRNKDYRALATQMFDDKDFMQLYNYSQGGDPTRFDTQMKRNIQDLHDKIQLKFGNNPQYSNVLKTLGNKFTTAVTTSFSFEGANAKEKTQLELERDMGNLASMSMNRKEMMTAPGIIPETIRNITTASVTDASAAKKMIDEITDPTTKKAVEDYYNTWISGGKDSYMAKYYELNQRIGRTYGVSLAPDMVLKNSSLSGKSFVHYNANGDILFEPGKDSRYYTDPNYKAQEDAKVKIRANTDAATRAALKAEEDKKKKIKQNKSMFAPSSDQSNVRGMQ